MDSRIARLKAFVAARAEAKKTQKEVAAELGISQGQLSRVVHERDDVSRDLAFAIERATESWDGGQIVATEWKEYKPRLGRGARAATVEAGEKSTADSGTHAAVDPSADPEKREAAGCP